MKLRLIAYLKSETKQFKEKIQKKKRLKNLFFKINFLSYLFF